MPRGRLIAVEGIDGVGKTTLATRLEKRGCVYFKMPDRGNPVGRLVNDFLQSRLKFSDDPLINERAAQLLFGACALCSYDAIEAQLRAGKNVVVDRYMYSGMAYHAASTIDGAYTWVDVERLIKETYGGLPKPDHIVLLDMDPKDAAQRIADRYGDERNDNIDVQVRVRRWYDLCVPQDAVRLNVTCMTADDVERYVARACGL